MAYRSVLYRKQAEARGVDSQEALPLVDAINKVKEMAAVTVKRNYKGAKKRAGKPQTVDLVIHLGIDPKQSDQMLRGAVSLPKGLGKTRSVIAFCDGPLVEQAKAAGALEAGADELIEKVQKGWTDFDVAVAHPSLMGKVGRLGRVLGPAGKMPTPKAGTVTADIVQAVNDFKGGRLEFRNDDGGNVHLPVGKSSFSAEDLKENIETVLNHIHRIKPASAKGHYVKRVALSATMTPSVSVAVSSS